MFIGYRYTEICRIPAPAAGNMEVRWVHRRVSVYRELCMDYRQLLPNSE